MAQIFLYDEFNPEDTAMLQALYSRSSKSVSEHVDKVRKTGSGKFMETFYIGYGHSSIADCGSTTIFIENLSILADKAIQDWPLYSGQETSTRYIDMGQQSIIDPLKSQESQAIINKWMDFYKNSQDEIREHLIKKYPKKEEEDDDVYKKAIKARSFDIARGFLPAGITTQLSWHTNLRQAYDKLSWLRNHPLEEVQEISQSMLKLLQEKYPHSFSQKINEKQEAYRQKVNQDHSFLAPKKLKDLIMKTDIKSKDLKKYQSVFDLRPPKTTLPNFIGQMGNLNFEFNLDYGSFRDIQRHRNGVCRMPLLSTDLGFNSWYLDQLPESLKDKALKLITEQEQALKDLDTSPEIKQYYIALGFNVFCQLSYNLSAAIYVIELRSGKTVHPTLRKIAHKMNQALLKKFNNLKIYCDLDKDDWDYRRGLQDIKKK